MDGRRVVEDYLRAIGMKMDCVVDFATGVCCFSYDYDNVLTVEVPPGSDVFVFHTPVMMCNGLEPGNLCKTVLSYALLGRHTAGCCLGYDEEDKQVLLSYQSEIENFNVQTFEDRLLAFIEQAQKVAKDLSTRVFNETR